MYETRDGKLRVTDGVGPDAGGGDPLILGENILTFSAEQSEDKAKSKVKVKGQRSKKDIRGKKALEKTHKTVTNSKVKSKNLLTVQHYGDATDKELERRARFEMNKRNSASQKITIEVFHVQTPSGQPWDIGNTPLCRGAAGRHLRHVRMHRADLSRQRREGTEDHADAVAAAIGGAGGGGGGGGGAVVSGCRRSTWASARRAQSGRYTDCQRPVPGSVGAADAERDCRS